MKILIAEDDNATRNGIHAFLTMQKHDVKSVANGIEAYDLCIELKPDLIISDVKMPGMTGIELLAKLRGEGHTIPMIVMTAFATIEDAVKAMKNGADDYLNKPLNLEALNIKINQLEKKWRLIQENQTLKKKLNLYENPNLLGQSTAFKRVRTLLDQISNDPDIPVMIYGESGTGKELVAKTIHRKSTRSNDPFIAVNCAALPENLLESELFGYKKGAFTGAVRDKKGLFQAAHKGTLFLDEVSEMSPLMQAKLLRTLQEGVILPIGETSPLAVDVRVLGASNKNLKEMVKHDQFREDLYFRLNVLEITIPPLRERAEDIPLLLQHFTRLYGKDRRMYFSHTALKHLLAYPWPGNVRELENFTRRMLVTSHHECIQAEDIPENYRMEKNTILREKVHFGQYKQALSQVIETFERDYFLHHLKIHDFNISQTAQDIGLSRVALHKKIKIYNLCYEE